MRVGFKGDYAAGGPDQAGKQYRVEAKIRADIKDGHPRANDPLQRVPLRRSNPACAVQAQVKPSIE
jgi:hypothetical protein